MKTKINPRTAPTPELIQYLKGDALSDIAEAVRNELRTRDEVDEDVDAGFMENPYY